MDDLHVETPEHVCAAYGPIRRVLLEAAIAIEVVGTSDADLTMWLDLSEGDLEVIDRAVQRRLARAKP